MSAFLIHQKYRYRKRSFLFRNYIFLKRTFFQKLCPVDDVKMSFFLSKKSKQQKLR